MITCTMFLYLSAFIQVKRCGSDDRPVFLVGAAFPRGAKESALLDSGKVLGLNES